MNDPILDSMFEGEEFESEVAPRREFDPKYGEGQWPSALLTKVTPQNETDYGHSIMLSVELTPDNPQGAKKPFTFFINAPRKPLENGNPDKYEEALKSYQSHLNQLKTIVHATGYWVKFSNTGEVVSDWPKQGFSDFTDDAQYAKLIGFLRQLEGRRLGLNVKINQGKTPKADGTYRYYKSVWGRKVVKPKETETVPF